MTESFPSFWAWLHEVSSYKLIVIGTTKLTPGKIFIAIFLLWLFNLLAHAAEKAFHRALIKRDYDPGAKASMERFARYGVFTLGIFFALSYIGVNMSTLETFGAVLGVGIGFGLQNITQNFISGLILLTERPIKRGDLVDVDGTVGRVLDIRARSTLILTRDDVVIIVPNSEFITKQVVNQSFSGDKIRYTIQIGAAYDADVEKVRELLLEAAGEHPKVLKTPPPSVVFKDFGTSSLDFSLRVWLSELWFNEVILSEIRFEIEKKFKANDIQIPYQQLDIYVKSLPKSDKVRL